MSRPRSKRQQAIRRRRLFLCSCVLVLAIVIGGVWAAFRYIPPMFTDSNESGSGSSSNISSTPSDSKNDNKTYTATVINTGDIILHSTVLDGAKTSSGGYDFSAFFGKVDKYFKGADLAVANLEVTLAGDKYKYSGYPSFNSPDNLIDTCKQAGLGLLLTANNHSYDTRLHGLKRTVQVLKEKNMAHIGTKEVESDPTYLVKDVNGIKLGITCFTYETDSGSASTKALNGIPLAAEANNLVNSFCYTHIEDFYTQAQSVISSMKKDGADAVIFYMHWGQEYQLTANTWQKTIAQKLADFGVDVIVGGHPHFVQPIDVIYGEGRDEQTVCLYSMGNAISNQRRGLDGLPMSGHTEDGVLFSYTFEKKNGETTLKAVDIIPTWVDKYKGGSGYQYTMYAIESKSAIANMGVNSTLASSLKASYDRTMKTVGSGLTKCQQQLGCDVREIEE